MTERRRLGAHVGAGRDASDGASAAGERFREAMARWASTVTVVAIRDEGGSVHATTVTSFAPVSDRPPQVVISLSPQAQALPFAKLGSPLGVSLLAQDQARWASVFADPFPVDAPDWAETAGAPLIPGAAAALACKVSEVHPTEGGSRLVLCRVHDASVGEEGEPLLYWQRAYRSLGD